LDNRRDRPLRFGSSTGTHSFYTLPSTIYRSDYEYAMRRDFVPPEILRKFAKQENSNDAEKSHNELTAMRRIGLKGTVKIISLG